MNLFIDRTEGKWYKPAWWWMRTSTNARHVGVVKAVLGNCVDYALCDSLYIFVPCVKL